jgi:transcriptional regulator with XRE-family HTH domain
MRYINVREKKNEVSGDRAAVEKTIPSILKKNMNKTVASMKREIGGRFKRFREAINKTQTQMAKELGVYQSTITNIEVGKTFPSLKYLYHYHHSYGLNINWLLSNVGELFVTLEERTSTAASLLECHVQKNDPRHYQYREMIHLMQVPEVEQIILAKMVELKVLAKEEINTFLKKQKTRLNLSNA